MVFIACGLNHKTAPLHIREKFALNVTNNDGLLQRFTRELNINEAAILSTCNRTEIYCNTSNPNDIISWVASEKKITSNTIKPYFYSYYDSLGIKHLIRVGSGLDSMMLGEPQILGQIKQAYNDASNAGTIGKELDGIFQHVFQSCKKIRNLSGIGKNPISIAYAAAQLVKKIFSEPQKLNVFLIGSGDTSRLVAKYLYQDGVKNFMVSSKTSDNANQLSAELQGISVSILDIGKHLSKADVIISATSCPVPFINKAMVTRSLVERNNKDMFFLDLAVPRDIEPDVADLENVYLYNIDNLQNTIEQSMHKRMKAATLAEELIEQEVNNFINLDTSANVNQVIHGYQKHMQKLSTIELNRALNKISTGKCPYEVLNEFSRRLTNKLTHIPKLGLRHMAIENQDKLQELINYVSKK